MLQCGKMRILETGVGAKKLKTKCPFRIAREFFENKKKKKEKRTQQQQEERSESTVYCTVLTGYRTRPVKMSIHNMLSKVNLNDPKTLTLLGITVGVGGALAYQLTRPKGQTIKAVVQCHCGKVKGDISAPKDSTPAAACHCNDCLTFVSWMNDEKKSPVDVSTSYRTSSITNVTSIIGI